MQNQIFRSKCIGDDGRSLFYAEGWLFVLNSYRECLLRAFLGLDCPKSSAEDLWIALLLEARTTRRDSFRLDVREGNVCSGCSSVSVHPAPYESQHSSLHRDGNLYPGTVLGSSQAENACLCFSCAVVFRSQMKHE